VAVRPLNLISLCTGGAGLDLGVELVLPSARPVCLVEREAFAVAHLVEAMRAGLLAPAPIWSDARTFRGRRWRGCVDGLIGGIPCQPHSHAGRRLGAADERDLWSPTRRIIVQARPWFVLIENVPGMLSAKPGETPGAERVWRDLQRLGFEVEGGLFEAPEVGGTDERQRIFILGVARGRSVRCGAGNERDLGAEAPGRSALATTSVIALADASGARRDGAEDAGTDRPHESRRPFASGRRSAGRVQSERTRDVMANAGDARLQVAQQPGQPGQPGPEERGFKPRSTASELRGAHVVDAGRGGCDGRPEGAVRGSLERAPLERPSELPLWPPRPNDLDAWREVLALWPAAQPAVRGMADGLAHRVDRLRMLGNGVKPLQAAYALRTLATDLSRRSAGAAELVRLMDEDFTA